VGYRVRAAYSVLTFTATGLFGSIYLIPDTSAGVLPSYMPTMPFCLYCNSAIRVLPSTFTGYTELPMVLSPHSNFLPLEVYWFSRLLLLYLSTYTPVGAFLHSLLLTPEYSIMNVSVAGLFGVLLRMLRIARIKRLPACLLILHLLAFGLRCRSLPAAWFRAAAAPLLLRCLRWTCLLDSPIPACAFHSCLDSSSCRVLPGLWVLVTSGCLLRYAGYERCAACRDLMYAIAQGFQHPGLRAAFIPVASRCCTGANNCRFTRAMRRRLPATHLSPLPTASGELSQLCNMFHSHLRCGGALFAAAALPFSPLPGCGSVSRDAHPFYFLCILCCSLFTTLPVCVVLTCYAPARVPATAPSPYAVHPALPLSPVQRLRLSPACVTHPRYHPSRSNHSYWLPVYLTGVGCQLELCRFAAPALGCGHSYCLSLRHVARRAGGAPTATADFLIQNVAAREHRHLRAAFRCYARTRWLRHTLRAVRAGASFCLIL